MIFRGKQVVESCKKVAFFVKQHNQKTFLPQIKNFILQIFFQKILTAFLLKSLKRGFYLSLPTTKLIHHIVKIFGFFVKSVA